MTTKSNCKSPSGKSGKYSDSPAKTLAPDRRSKEQPEGQTGKTIQGKNGCVACAPNEVGKQQRSS